ncbi:T11L2 protein, partial [Atractosteus spatula]|nr:T11L2 protein [Atractosteus spatula]
MPLQDERPSASSDPEQDADPSERRDSTGSSSDGESSRRSFSSDASSRLSSPASSPPKLGTFDELMVSARDLSNLSLAHEIIVNGDFHVKQPDLPQDSLERRVKEIVHKAFWDRLEAELSDDPPEYEYAIRLLEEIKETLLSFLNPGANRLRNLICEVLDMDLIRQQVDNEALDIRALADYVVFVMGKLCAPVRDEEVRKLKENSGSVVSLFREIFRVLDLMKMDMVNYTIQSLRPQLQYHSIEYERAKFQSIVEKTPSALDHTTEWIKETIEELMSAKPVATQESGPPKATGAIPSPIVVLNTGYVKLLSWDYRKRALPETLMTDEVRLRELQQRLGLLKAVACVLLVVYNTVGGSVSGLPALADRLKRIASVLLEGVQSPSFNMTEALENVNTQICSELNKSLTERGYPALPAEVQLSLKGQICSITEENNPISSLIDERVQLYFGRFLCTPDSHAAPPAVPGGLSFVQPELAELGAHFARVVRFNMQVYSPFYTGIMRKLLFSAAPGPAAAGAAPAPVATG